MESHLNSISEIQTFFQDKSVFLTGAMGFVGQMVLEKLLRSTPVENVYILARSKNQIDAQKRLDLLLKSKIYDTIRNQNEDLLKKVILITGDVSLPGLGMSNSDAALISDRVSVVIHSAANVKFDEPLRVAIRINVGGSKNLYEFSKSIKSLQSVVYISTAYSNCFADIIEEKIYPVNLDPHLAVSMCENLSQEQMDSLSPSLVQTHPNTYAYSKHLAESLGNSYKGILPISIVRPSITTPTHKEPITGYITGFGSSVSGLVGVYYGIMRTVYFTTMNIDLIPVDHVVNAILAAAWQTSIHPREPSEDVPVYNIVSGTDNPLYSDMFFAGSLAGMNKFPLQNRLWKPNQTVFTRSYAKYWVYDFLFHKIPGRVLRTLKLKRTQKLAKFYDSMEMFRKGCKLFNETTFFFSVDNKNRLLSALSPDDRVLFDFDITKLSWEHYMLDYMKGLRTYIFKEDCSNCIGEKKEKSQICFLENQKVYLLLTIITIVLVAVALKAMAILKY